MTQEKRTPEERGSPSLGDVTPELLRSGSSAFTTSLDVLATSLREAPAFVARRRTRELGSGAS